MTLLVNFDAIPTGGGRFAWKVWTKDWKATGEAKNETWAWIQMHATWDSYLARRYSPQKDESPASGEAPSTPRVKRGGATEE